MPIKKHLIILSMTLMLSLSFAALAEHNHGRAGSGPNPYRDCGIGAAIFAETGWAAATSNSLWDLGTTAVTSATWSPETCSKAHVKTAKFIIDNYDNLIEDVAKGGGEHLVAVLGIEGCPSSVLPEVIAAIRSSIGDKVLSESYSQKNQIDRASDYYNAVTSAASTCTI